MMTALQGPAPPASNVANVALSFVALGDKAEIGGLPGTVSTVAIAHFGAQQLKQMDQPSVAF